MEVGDVVEFLKDMNIDPLMVAIIGLGASFIPLMLRGLFAFSNAQHARRKEFIEQLLKPEIQTDNLAIEMLIKNGYGIWLPSNIIRRIQQSNFPSRIFRGLSDIEGLFEPADSGSELKFSKVVSSERYRFWTRIALTILYALSVLIAGAAFTGIYEIDKLSLGSRMVIGIVFSMLGALALEKGQVLLRVEKFIHIYARELQPEMLNIATAQKIGANDPASPSSADVHRT